MSHILKSRTGGKSGVVSKCKNCRGSGIQVTHRQIGPGMLQQMQSMCSDCGGTGDYIREKDKCKKCKGKRLIEVDHKQEVRMRGVLNCILTFNLLHMFDDL